jgi:hypothetical protein
VRAWSNNVLSRKRIAFGLFQHVKPLGRRE